MTPRIPMVEESHAPQQSVPVEKVQKSVAVAHKIMSELMKRADLQSYLRQALEREEVSVAAAETFLDWLQTGAIWIKLNWQSRCWENCRFVEERAKKERVTA